MSALGGILNFGVNPPAVDERLMAELGGGLDSRGPDGGREVCFDHIGMSYRAFHTTPESRLEVQPLVTSDGHILAWNGRLDNREELLRRLRDHLYGDPANITDVEIVMAAYLKWSKDCFVRLIGDFCLALWDARLKVLHLVRDVIGTRTLNFQTSSSRVIWSTELPALLAVSGISREINEEYLAGFLTSRPETGLTPYKNIYAVKPGYVVTISHIGRLEESRYWGLDPNKEIRYKADKEFEEHFLHELANSVKCRLRSDRPVFAELSGGLDSSSIVCMADQIMKSGEAQTPKLETVSFVYDEASRCDERKYIRCVEEKRGQTGYHLREDDFRVLAPLASKHFITSIPNPLNAFAEYHTALRELMREKGARVLLTGNGGDQLLNSTADPSPELGDLLVQCKFRLLHNRLQAWGKALKKPYLGILWQNAVMPTLPRKLQSICKTDSKFKLLELFNHEFTQRVSLRDRMLGQSDVFGFRYPSQRDQSTAFLSIVRFVSAGYRQEQENIEISFPYLHRPLVEFLQAIPFEQRLRPGETRSIMRRAARDLLPTEVAKRKGKANPAEALLRGVSREYPRLRLILADARVCALGYVDSDALLRALDRAKYAADSSSLAITGVISLEFWLRALERQSFAAKRSAAVVGPPAAQPIAVQADAGHVAARST